MTSRRLLLLTLLLAACSAPIRSAPPPDDGEQLVREADAQARASAYPVAARLFEEMLRWSPPSPFADRALLGLGRLLVQPENPGRDYVRAYRTFDRLLREYPQSPLRPEARAWRDVLAAYLARGDEIERLRRGETELEREVERRKKAATDLERQVERLKKAESDLERQVERLKQIDLELERQRRR